MIGFGIFYGDMYGFRIQITNQIGITVIAAESTSTDSFYIEKCHIGVSKEVLNSHGDVIDAERMTKTVMDKLGYVPNQEEKEMGLFMNVPIDTFYEVFKEVKEMVSH